MDEDLSVALPGLMETAKRPTKEGRRNLANSPTTRELLEAGLRIIERELERGDQILGRWLTMKKVINEFNRARKEKEQLTEAALRDRWTPHEKYIGDVISYALRKDYITHYLTLTDADRESLTEGDDFPRAVHEAAYVDLASAGRLLATRVQLIIATLAQKNEPARLALQYMYQEVGKTWIPVYKQILARLGKPLRPVGTATGPRMSVEEFAYCLTAMSEGLQLRMLADPDCPVLNHERKTSPLGVVALAMIYSCVDHTEDGRSLEELGREVVAET